MTDHDIVLAIQELLDGAVWTPETLNDIASILNCNGYPVRDVST